MRPGGGKSKGAGWERQVCRDLSLGMSGGARDDLFWRSAMSGGRASVQFKRGKQNLTQTGDITAIDPLGAALTDKFLVECKFYRDLILVGLFHGIRSGINGHWGECIKKASQHHKWPLLIARQNRMNALVCLDRSGATYFDLLDPRRNRTILIANFVSQEMYVIWYNQFLKLLPHLLNEPDAAAR